MLAPLALLGTFQAIREELPETYQAKFQLPNIIPSWPWWIWVIIILVVVIFIILESAYRIIQKRQKTEEIVARFATLMREADSLKIIWANNSTPAELDTILDEAIIWTKKAIKETGRMLGEVGEKRIRIETELPLTGEIKDEDFIVPYARSIYANKLSLVRDRHYKVYYWMRDFIETASLNPDK